jgi:hypothetical protein
MLSTFLRVVTGNRTLAQDRIKINIQDLGKNTIPNCHTCSNELVLSSEYDNKEIFNSRLNVFLEEAISGTGFQLI